MTDQEKKFYVYIHRKATDGAVFYVGKGQGKKAWTKYKRGKYWMNIVAKHGYTIHIIMRFNNEKCAFSLERALIKFYGRENLCNLTDGGEGLSGMVFSEDHKARISVSNKGKPKTIEQIEKMAAHHRGKTLTLYHRIKIGNAGKGRIFSEEHRNKIGVSGKGRSHSAATLDKLSYAAGRRSEEYIKKMIYTKTMHPVYNFFHRNGDKFTGTQLALRKAYNLHQANLSSVINGRRVSCGGWILAVDTQLQL